MERSETSRIRVGVAGGGLIAQAVHLPTLRALGDRFEVAGLADPSPAVRERVAGRHGVPATLADHRALLELDLDAILVCAPNGLHAEIVLDALDAGCHVLVEKPLCLTLEDADRIAARRSELGLVVQVGYMKRFDPGYEALRSVLAASPAGDAAVRHASSLTVDPGLARAFRPPGFVPAAGIPARDAERLAERTAAQVAQAIGSDDPAHVVPFSDAFLGALVHDVNLGLGALGDPAGEPRVVDAFGEPGGRLAGGAVELPGGARWTLAWVLAEGAGRFSEELRITGDDGVRTLRFAAPYLRQASAELTVEHARGAIGSQRTAAASYADAYTRELEHFHACVTGGEPCRTPPEQARADMALITRMYRALVEERIPA